MAKAILDTKQEVEEPINPIVDSKWHPDIVKRVKEVLAKRWSDKIPAGYPPFDIEVSDGCTGVRGIAAHCCIIHDADYWYGTTWYDKLLADWRLANCVWQHGRARMGADHDPDPWSTAPAWFFLAFSRGLGVALFAWRPFYKPHKRKKL